MRQNGCSYAGVYASGSNITQDVAPGVIANVPDDIWVPNYNGQPVTTPLSGVVTGWWGYTQRAHQYRDSVALISNKTQYTWDLNIVNSTVTVKLDPPPSCDEGCTAACYNNTSQWCGSTCMNCCSCSSQQTASCVNGTPQCTTSESYYTSICGPSAVPQNFDEYPTSGCPGSGYQTSNGCCCAVCPIVIDAFNEGFRLTSALGGVKFTVLPVDGPSQVSWTDGSWHNGRLALNCNGNSKIDDFTELFGNLTPQPLNPERNGYLALAVFDDPANGGNGNGAIDPEDSVFDHLLLWIDANHNGVSEPEELHSFRDMGIFRIDLKYKASNYTDANGNRFRYKAKMLDAASKWREDSYDVFLTVETQQ